MPAAVSKRQYRMMMAIAHSGPKNGRQPPARIAAKYSKPDGDVPDSKNNDRGGRWDKHHDKEKSKKEEKSKKDMKKSFEQFYSGKGAGVIVVDDDGKILVGKGRSGKWQTPGGHVDPGEDFDEAAHRELREEAGIVAGPMVELGHFKMNGNDSKTFMTTSFTGTVKDSDELKELQFAEPHEVLDWDLRDCSRKGVEDYVMSALKKSTKLKDMMAVEKLEKNIIRGGARSDMVLDVSHGDALSLVGNGCFRWLRNSIADMQEEDFKDIHLDNHVISIRKHITDMYSGRISDGHKVVHQFTNKSLPQLCADIMSVFEWYSDEDEHVFNILDDENLSDDAIHGGLAHLTENYTKNNLANIYTEMENIREEIRHGNAVDLQQIEEKMMKLFDKLEETTHHVISQHNKLSQDSGKEIEILEEKLRELANKVDELSKKPEEVEAYQTKPISGDKVYDSHYLYLPRPEIHIEPNGKIKIAFNQEWTDMEKSNFLKDMKANIIRRN